MAKNNANIYKRYRTIAGITQEHAAELLNLSIESIQAFETEQRVPRLDIVRDMSIIYNAPFLLQLHAQRVGSTPDVPEVTDTPLPEAALKLIGELDDMPDAIGKIVKITADGKITDDERDEWKCALSETKDVISAALTLIIAGKDDKNKKKTD